MKISNKLASALNITDEEKQYIASINKRHYCKLNFIIKIFIVLATIMLPIIYVNIVSHLHYVNHEVIIRSNESTFALYDVMWISHVIALFLFIPSFSLIVFYTVIKRNRDFNSFVTLKSIIVYSINVKKLFAATDSTTLDEKIKQLNAKFIQIIKRIMIISVFLFINLLFFDMNNYTIITSNGIFYKKYATITEEELSWKDLEKVSIGCNQTIASYMSPFSVIKWDYILFFKNGLVLDLYKFSAIKGEKIDAINTIDSIIKALEIKSTPSNYSTDIFDPKILNRKCRQYLMSNYSNKDYNSLVNILRLKEKP